MRRLRQLAVLGALSAALALAGCGGGGGSGGEPQPLEVQQVRGPRLFVQAPKDWKVEVGVRQVTARPPGGGDTLVSVSVFGLVKPFRPSLWARAIRELDAAAEKLAVELGGRVDDRRTVRVGSLRARQYRLSYVHEGKRLRQRITFALRGRAEYQLLCRWASGQPEPRACGLLLASFRPA